MSKACRSPDAIVRITLKGHFDGFSIFNINTMLITHDFELLDVRDKSTEEIVFSTRFRGKEEFETLISRLRKDVQGVTHVEHETTQSARV